MAAVHARTRPPRACHRAFQERKRNPSTVPILSDGPEGTTHPPSREWKSGEDGGRRSLMGLLHFRSRAVAAVMDEKRLGPEAKFVCETTAFPPWMGMGTDASSLPSCKPGGLSGGRG